MLQWFSSDFVLGLEGIITIHLIIGHIGSVWLPLGHFFEGAQISLTLVF